MNGRNLLRFTGHPTYAGENNAANRQNGWCRWNAAATIERTSEGIKYTHNAASSNPSGFVVPLISETLLQGGEDEVLTLSFQYRGNLVGKTALYLLANTGGNVTRRTNVRFESSEAEWRTFTDTVYFPTLGTRYATALLVPYSDGDTWFEVKDGTMKLEYGTTATPWRPAPEDIEQPSDLVYASEGVDLGDTSGDKLIANINLAGDTAKISATHVEINGQTTFNAIKQYSDAAYDASGAATGAVHALKTDLASSTGTTVIDGARITTGTIDAARINASSLAIGGSTLGTVLDGKASTADVANAAKRTYVSIRATAIDYVANTATLEATLYIDGTATTTGVTYAWLLDGATISGATSRTYSVPASSGLNHAYSCKCTATI